jgi:hypothetical protein
MWLRTKRRYYNKPIMGNPCGRGRCKDTTCDLCGLYSPTILGVRVPRWLGSIGFKLEEWLYCRKMK